MRSNTLRLLAAWAVAGILALYLRAVPPAWWTERGVLTPNTTANDYAAANFGQVKFIAKQAVAEMNAKLPGGAGAELNALVAAWALASAPGVVRNDFAAVNQGQLKALAKPFYERLAVAGYIGPPLSAGQTYPWTTATDDDASYAAVNIGQVKRVFSFVPSLLNPSSDADGDGLPNFWETQFGLDPLSDDAAGDPDGDGWTNLIEFRRGGNPTRAPDAAFASALELRLAQPLP